MADLCIAVIHGMGTQQPRYSVPMRDEINNRLGADASRVKWKEIYWASILSQREKDYLDEANKHNPRKSSWPHIHSASSWFAWLYEENAYHQQGDDAFFHYALQINILHSARTSNCFF